MVQIENATRDQGGGLGASLPIATPQGWRDAGALQVGDRLFCLDGPPQPILQIVPFVSRMTLGILVPQAALGNPDPVILLPSQPVALDLDQASVLYGDPVVLVPAAALLEWRGISACRLGDTRHVRISFARSQVIYAGPGLLVGCSGIGPMPLRPLGPPAPPLTARQAIHLMACVIAQETGAGLRDQAALAALKRP